jgi:hypothetical protein
LGSTSLPKRYGRVFGENGVRLPLRAVIKAGSYADERLASTRHVPGSTPGRTRRARFAESLRCLPPYLHDDFFTASALGAWLCHRPAETPLPVRTIIDPWSRLRQFQTCQFWHETLYPPTPPKGDENEFPKTRC